jgi:two-component system sensor histidine kinase QseC
VSLVSAPLVYVSLRRILLRQFDQALKSEARSLGPLLRRDSRGSVRLEPEAQAMPEFSGGQHVAYFEVFTQSGAVVARSPALGMGDLAFRPGNSSAAIFDVKLPDGRAGRAVQLLVVPESEDEEDEERTAPPGGSVVETRGPVVVVLAGDRTHVDETLRALLVGLIVSAALVSVLAVLLVAHTVRRGLVPLARLADQAAGADVASLTYRFAAQDMPLELAPICRRLNDLLERLAAARERERRFTSDVAHELRTPIAELRSLAEVALKWPADAAATRQSFAEALDVARQMEAMVTTLLTLARSETGARLVAQESVRLLDVIRTAWRPWAATARERGLDVTLDVPEDAALVTDATLLASILGNLLSNAACYAARGGTLSCRAARSSGRMEIEVANTSDSLQAGDLPRLFDPFWRKDPARSGSGHAGLGLSLVAAYARLLGAEISTDLSAGSFRVRLCFAGDSQAAEAGEAVVRS